MFQPTEPPGQGQNLFLKAQTQDFGLFVPVYLACNEKNDES